MRKRKTQNSGGALSGLQGIFDFEQIPFSPPISQTQIAFMQGYRIDPRLIVQPIWRRHHG
jgi:hypothetical protein